MTTITPLSQPLRKRVNRLAHLMGTHHAERMKVELSARLVELRESGAGFDDLVAELARLEPGGEIYTENGSPR